jgi:C4-dicarboxylate transporter/malic acid transport protein.
MRLENMTGMWFLSFLPSIVAASSGSLVAQALQLPEHRGLTVTMSYFAWSVGVLPAMTLAVLYIFRFLEYKMPSQSQVMSMMIPVGPFGLGTFG